LYILTVIFATVWEAKKNSLTWFNQVGVFLGKIAFLFHRRRALARGAQEGKALNRL